MTWILLRNRSCYYILFLLLHAIRLLLWIHNNLKLIFYHQKTSLHLCRIENSNSHFRANNIPFPGADFKHLSILLVMRAITLNRLPPQPCNEFPDTSTLSSLIVPVSLLKRFGKATWAGSLFRVSKENGPFNSSRIISFPPEIATLTNLVSLPKSIQASL